MTYPNWTEQDLQEAKERMSAGRSLPVKSKRVVPSGASAAPSSYKGYRSKLEYNWAGYLDGLKALKAIDDWRYEPMNFRLPGQKNFYKIDFQSWVGPVVTFYEIKGRNKSDERSLVKIKTAAGLHPWARFILVKRISGQWEERVII